VVGCLRSGGSYFGRQISLNPSFGGGIVIVGCSSYSPEIHVPSAKCSQGLLNVKHNNSFLSALDSFGGINETIS
jgi:hypothetical protein